MKNIVANEDFTPYLTSVLLNQIIFSKKINSLIIKHSFHAL